MNAKRLTPMTKTMNRTDPNFKEQSVLEMENLEFVNELFDNLFDGAPIDSDTDKVPDLSILDAVR